MRKRRENNKHEEVEVEERNKKTLRRENNKNCGGEE